MAAQPSNGKQGQGKSVPLDWKNTATAALSGQPNNPYLQQMGQGITDQITQNTMQNVLPGINAGAMVAGGFGGSRQGVAQGVAISNMNRDISNALANQAGQIYESAQNRAGQAASLLQNNEMQDKQLANQKDWQFNQLSNALEIAKINDASRRIEMANQYDLGKGNLGLGQFGADTNRYVQLGQLGLQGQKQALDQMLGQQAARTNQYQAETGRMGTLGGLSNNQYQAETGRMGTLGNLALNYGQLDATRANNEMNFYTQQRGQDLQALGLGSQIFGQGYQGLLGSGQGMYNTGVQEFDSPWKAFNNYAAMIVPNAGLGATQVNTQPGGGSSPFAGIAGALGSRLGAGVGNWFGGSGGSNSNNGYSSMDNNYNYGGSGDFFSGYA